MIYYRCKCGARLSYSSMGVPDCTICDKCGSTLAAHPDCHGPRAPHVYAPSPVETDEGKKTLTFCMTCHRRRSEIQAACQHEDEGGHCKWCGLEACFEPTP